MSLSSMFSRFSGQPSSYERRVDYKFGRTLGAGSYGIVREAEGVKDGRKYAVKIVMKKTIKDNEQMIYDELEMLQRMNHPNIIKFRDWFESKDKFYIITQLAVGGELFKRVCDRGRFTEKDASQTVRQILNGLDYLHYNNVVHRDLKPENVLLLTEADDSELVLADFGIAKMLDDKNELLTTMAGSFGYAAPEIMLRSGHGKPVDLWSLGVLTFTLLGGYSPFRSESIPALLEEISRGDIVFHDRFWSHISPEAKSFIKRLLQVKPGDRPTCEEALQDIWLTGETATDHDITPELRSFMVRARLQHGVGLVALARRIEALKKIEDVGGSDGLPDPSSITKPPAKRTRSDKGAIFRAVVLAKVREMKMQEALKEKERALS